MWIVYGLIPPPSRSKNACPGAFAPNSPETQGYFVPLPDPIPCGSGWRMRSWRVAIRQGFRKKWEVWHQEKTASLLYPVGLIYPFPCCWPGGGVFSPLGGLWSMRESGPRSPALDATSPGRTTRISVRIDWQMARPILCSQDFLAILDSCSFL